MREGVPCSHLRGRLHLSERQHGAAAVPGRPRAERLLTAKASSFVGPRCSPAAAGDLVMAFTAPYSTQTDKSESRPPVE